MTGIERITAERKRQIDEEGWTPEHDDEHEDGELVQAAVCYAANRQVFIKTQVTVGEIQTGDAYVDPWPWDRKWDKRKTFDRMRQLEIAGALIAAELDRFDRMLEVIR